MDFCRKTILLLIFSSFMSVGWGQDCDEGYTEIDSLCYYQTDLDVLQQFIDNSQGGDNPPPSDLSPIELGEQEWEDGRLIELVSSPWYPYYEPYELYTTIPPEIGNLENLELLILWYNKFTGDIPPEIGSLVNLEGLFLNNNELSGEIPLEISNLVNLTTLWIYANQLNGEIPENICNLVNLNWFSPWSGEFYSYIHDNQLCPPYPECIEDYVGYQDTSECINIGDVNGDLEINILDVVTLVNIITVEGEYTEYGDMNYDGYLNILDVVTLVNFILDN